MATGSAAELKALIKEFMDWTFASNPIEATFMGVHDHDARLGEYSREAIAAMKAKGREYLARFNRLDRTGLTMDEKIDVELAEIQLETALKLDEALAEWRRNPFYADLPTYGCYILLTREFAPLEQRLESLLGRLRETPRVLAEGKDNVDDPVRVFVETAAETAQGGLMLFQGLVPVFAAQAKSEALKREIEEANAEAIRALEDYVAHIRSLLPKAREEFGTGREIFDYLLKRRHQLDYDADTLYAKGEELFAGTLRQMEETAREIDPGRTWEECVEEIKRDHPTAGDLLDTYRRAMDGAREFVIERGVVDIPPGESLEFEETPPFMRPVIPYAAYVPPAPFEKEQLGRFFVTPVDLSADAEHQEAQLRDHNRAGIPVTALHEAYPGHHLQLCWSNQCPSEIRRLSVSTLFAEGWAFYCEELMEELGFLKGPKTRLMRLKDQLWRAGRIILDAALHTRGMTVNEAVEFFVTRVHMERPNAVAEIRRYTTSPTQPMSYLIGKLEILKLAADYRAAKGAAFDRRRFHNELLSHGTIAPALVRRILLG